MARVRVVRTVAGWPVVVGLLCGLLVVPRVVPGGVSPDGGAVSASVISGVAAPVGPRVVGGGRGVDDVEVVERSAGLVGDVRTVLGSGDGLGCLSGDVDVGLGCVVSQLEPELVAASECRGVPGEFRVREGSVNGSGVVSFAYRASPAPGEVPSTLVTEAVQGGSYSWAFAPTMAAPGCPVVSEGSWRSFRVDVVRAGVEESFGVGPLRVGLSSGSLGLRVGSTRVGLVGGSVGVGLAYRSPGGVGYVSKDPSGVLPGGWSLDGLGGVTPWVTAAQVGSGDVPMALVLTAFDGQQVEFTNTLAGSGATGGAWAPPVQVGWASGQFGSLVDSGDLTAAGSTLTWSSGQQVVTFERVGETEFGGSLWGVSESREVEPGGLSGASVVAEWEESATKVPRLKSLVDPVSGKSVSFVYSSDSSGGSCAGVEAPVDGGDKYFAPEGLLCGWTNFDGRITHVWYSPPVADPNGVDVTDAYQVGWVQGPGGMNTQLHWVSDGGRSPPQLRKVQAPLGHDAQGKAGLSESDSSWFVNYDGFGHVESVVSPKPGVESVVPAANTDRVARVFSYLTDSEGDQWTRVSHGVLADQDEPTQVVEGASLIDEVRYDGAWRPVRYAVASSRPGTTDEFFFVNKTWDAVHDRLLVVETPNGRQTVSQYDYLSRLVARWGPAPGAAFTTGPDGEVLPLLGDDALISTSSSFDADAAGTLAGLTVSMFTSPSPAGLPAASLGSCVEGQCPDSDSPPLAWTELPSSAGVTGGGWSLNAIATREAPVDGDALRYRVTTDSDAASVTLYASGVCNTVFTAATCTPTVAVPPSTLAGEPVTLQVQYARNSTPVSQSAPLTVTLEESTDRGVSWSALTARDLDPGFGLASSNTQVDTFSQGGDVETISNESVFADPQRQQVATATVVSDGVTASMDHSFETYDGTATWGRTLSSTDFAGTTVSATYWGPNATTTNPCDGTTAPSQAGLQAAFTMAETTSGDPMGASTARVHDVAGRVIAQTHTSEDRQATYTVCNQFDARDQPLTRATTDAALSTSYAYPWNDPHGTDPFTTTASHTAPDTDRSPQTYKTSATVDLLGRTVSATDPWGTTTTTDHGVDPSTGVRTISSTTTTRAGFSVTQAAVVNPDGTTRELTRRDGTATLTAAYTYNDDSTVDTVTITNDATEIVTETRSYHPTTGAHTGSTWTRGLVTTADNQLTDAPNAMRVLGETISTGGVTYTWAYTYGGLSRLTGAKLSSTDSTISGTWAYAFTEDTAAESGENPDAHLNGNISSKTTTLNGGPAKTVDYHYDYADRLTRSTDPVLQGLDYDSFGNLTGIGANTITYNTTNAPIRATDGTTTVAYTRLLSYPIIEKTTTIGNEPATTIRYSHNGLILNPAGDALTQIHQFGPVTITTPATDPATTTTYQLNTLLGNRMLTLDHTGTPTSSTPDLFDPYGNPITTPNPNTADTPDYAWHAAVNAETESLTLPYVMMGARIYIPELGRFTSPDPIPGASNSEYTYARSDPINYHDPNGLEPKKQHANGQDKPWKHFWNTDLPDDSHKFGNWIHYHRAEIVKIAIITAIIIIWIAAAALTSGAAAYFADAELEVGTDLVAGDVGGPEIVDQPEVGGNDQFNDFFEQKEDIPSEPETGGKSSTDLTKSPQIQPSQYEELGPSTIRKPPVSAAESSDSFMQLSDSDDEGSSSSGSED